MKTRSLIFGSLSFAGLLVTAGPARADFIEGVPYDCLPVFDLATGNVKIECTPEDLGDHGTGGGGQNPLPIQGPPVEVLSATYGANCGAPVGNQTLNLARACDGASSCSYTIDYRAIGDPAVRCAKQYQFVYRCGDDGAPKVGLVAAEAGFDKVAYLYCY
jgi:hypothetical protein